MNGLFGNLQNLPRVEQLGILTQSVLIRLVNIESVVVNGGGVGAFTQLLGGNGPERIARLDRVGVGARLSAGRGEERAAILQRARRLRGLRSQGDIGNLGGERQESGGLCRVGSGENRI